MPLSNGYILNNRYQIIGLLGQGGFGAVYQARDTSLNHNCAIKENLGPVEVSRQFEREAEILANLSHPGLPRVTDHFILPGLGQYLVMDLVEGKDLQELVELTQGPINENQAISWIQQVADALKYLHEQNPPVIHRDIKPANIILSGNGSITLVDFGLSKLHDPLLKTTLGAFGVSPGYSPPEQYGRGKTDVRSDIYALGATLYCLLTGIEPPESIQRNLGAVLTPPRVINASISPTVEQAVLKAMEVQPVKRFQSISAFTRALEGPPGITARASQYHVPSWSAIPGGRPGKDMTRLQLPRLIWIGLLVPLAVVLVFLVANGLKGNRQQSNSLQEVITPLAIERTFPVLSGTNPVTSVQPQVLLSTTQDPGLARLPEVYIVAQGDTCGELAERFNTTTEDLWRSNNLPGNCDQIFAGQKLLVPAPAREMVEWQYLTVTPVIPPGTTRIAGKDGMQLAYVPPGVFWHGSDERDSQSRPAEKPMQAIYLDGFWIDQTEVTNGMYATCVREGGCEAPAKASSQRNLLYYGQPAFNDYPVIHVSWNDAQRYCSWAGRRLPSEAEWEKAARGIDGRIYPWGNDPASGFLANYDNQIGDTTRVGSYPAGESPYGALDMAGNATEWVADWFDAQYYFTVRVINPTGPQTGEYRVQRGGSWLSQAYAIRSAHRLWNYPDSSFEGSGFRCAETHFGD